MDVKKLNVQKAYEKVKSGGGVVFPEPMVKSWLKSAGVEVPRGVVAKTKQEASAAAKKLGFPIVAKLVSDRVLHKTELGGVKVGIQSDKELKKAFDDIARSVKKSGFAFEGVLVEKQAEAGVEIIAGLQNDPHFGPVLMVGLGGIYTDLLEDVVFRMLPVTRRDVESMLGDLKGAKLLKGFRGAAAPNMKAVVDAIMAIAALGKEIAPYFESADFNPIIATPKNACVVDAKIVLAQDVKKNPFASEKQRTKHLEKFFNPASVAVIGASAGEGKIGNVIIDSLVNHEYKGRVYPINPNRKEILGAKCYPSLKSLPVTPDMVVMVIDLKEGPALMRELNELGIHNLLIVAGGGKELGGERENIEKEIAVLARKLDIRVIGPNCIGAFDGTSRFDSFFHHRERMVRPPAGPISFMTQSGTWGCGFLEFAHVTGVSKMVSYGNRVDIDEGDLISCYAKDESTRVISSYIEGLSQGRKFVAEAKESISKQGKPVVVFKTGRNARSAQAAISHTGAYGGSYKVYEGVFKQAGIVAVDSFHELYAASNALALQPPAAGPRAAMLSNGAGPMVNALDLFPKKGLELVTLSRKSVKAMRDHFSFFYLVENPVDVTGSASAADYEFVIRTMMDDPNVDVIMPFFVFQDTPLDESIVERLAELNAMKRKPIIGCAAGGPYTERMSRAIEKVGVPVLPDVAQWTAAASALVQWGRAKKK